MFYIFTINGLKCHIPNQLVAGVAALSFVVDQYKQQTQKVTAIKLIRSYVSSLGLKESKDLTEYIWEHAAFPNGLLEFIPKIENVTFQGTSDFVQ